MKEENVTWYENIIGWKEDGQEIGNVGRPETERSQETWKETKKETRKRKGRGEDSRWGSFGTGCEFRNRWFVARRLSPRGCTAREPQGCE